MNDSQHGCNTSRKNSSSRSRGTHNVHSRLTHCKFHPRVWLCRCCRAGRNVPVIRSNRDILLICHSLKSRIFGHFGQSRLMLIDRSNTLKPIDRSHTLKQFEFRKANWILGALLIRSRHAHRFLIHVNTWDKNPFPVSSI